MWMRTAVPAILPMLTDHDIGTSWCCSLLSSSTTASLVVLPRISCVWRATARTAWQASDKGIDQPLTHGCDRVRDVAFRPQGGILWVGNRRVLQVSGTERRNEVLRGE